MPGIWRSTFVNHRIIRFCCRVGLGTRLPASIIRLVRCGSVFSRLSVNVQPRRLSAFCCLPCCPILPHHERMCNTTPRIQFDRDEPCYFALFTHRDFQPVVMLLSCLYGEACLIVGYRRLWSQILACLQPQFRTTSLKSFTRHERGAFSEWRSITSTDFPL